MPKFKKRALFFLLVFLFIFSLAFVFQERVKNFVYLIFSPFQKFFWSLGRNTANFFSIFIETSELKKEKERLEKENLKLKSEIEKLKEIEKENRILKKALDLKREKIEILLARIVGKDPDEDKILIDKGKKDGVFEGEVVISPEGVLVGKVSKVYQNFSKITLLSSKNFSFNGQISSKKIDFLLEGRGNLHLYLTLLPKEKKIELGDKVSTSALGGKFPAGIFIGEIEKIERSDIKPYQEAKIKLGFSLSDLEFLFLIKNFKPWKES